MHIEPGVVAGAKIFLGHGTALATLAITAVVANAARYRTGLVALSGRTLLAALMTFFCFEVLPHHPVGVSEVHLILGTTLLLLFGTAPAALGLAGGLLAQGLLFAPSDLPQLGMNLTTLLVPLFATAALARHIVAPETAYVDLTYSQAFRLSAAYQGGIVAWVAFWSLWGQGLSSLGDIASFTGAYTVVLLVEPLVDLAVLAAVKGVHRLHDSALLDIRLFGANA